MRRRLGRSGWAGRDDKSSLARRTLDLVPTPQLIALNVLLTAGTGDFDFSHTSSLG
jgi:hypothetical protein